MRISALIFLALLVATPCPVHAQPIVNVGLAAPLSGDFQLLGRQWANGVRVAANAVSGIVQLVEADTGCTAEGGATAARHLAEADVSVVIGFLCTPAVEAAMPVLKEAGIPVITPVRTDSLTDRRERTGWPVYRLGPRDDDEQKAVADILLPRWRDAHFAIVDDGTLYGRELAENLRAETELAGLNPVFVDTFRPQLDNQVGLLGRLRNAGATHVFVGGDRADIAIMARDAAELDYDVTFAGGEALRAADGDVPLPAGILMVGLPKWSDVATPEALDAFQNAEILAEGYTLPGYAALEVAAEAARMAASQGVPVEDVLASASYETALGLVSFEENGDLAHTPYRLFRYDGNAFTEMD